MLLFGLCFPNVLSATESTTPSGITITDLKEFVDKLCQQLCQRIHRRNDSWCCDHCLKRSGKLERNQLTKMQKLVIG